MALNRSDKSRILRRYFPGMTRNSEMSTEPSLAVGRLTLDKVAFRGLGEGGWARAKLPSISGVDDQGMHHCSIGGGPGPANCSV